MNCILFPPNHVWTALRARTLALVSGKKGHQWTTNAAARYGHLNLLKHQQRSHRFTIQDADAAATGGHLHVLQWLRQVHGVTCSFIGANLAASNGHVHVLRWCESKCQLRADTYGANLAATNGHVDALEWLADRFIVCDERGVNNAARYGHVHVLQWARSTLGLECTCEGLEAAVQHGQLETVKWLFSWGNYRGSCFHIIMTAAMYGQLPILQWMFATFPEHRRWFRLIVVEQAVLAGQVDVVAWLEDVCGVVCNSRIARHATHPAMKLWLAEKRVATTAWVETRRRRPRTRTASPLANTRTASSSET